MKTTSIMQSYAEIAVFGMQPKGSPVRDPASQWQQICNICI